MTDDISRRAEHFSDNWLAWTALRHFLSAPLFRELARVIVEQVSEGAIQLHQLFEEDITSGADILASWLLLPRKMSGQPAEYLQYQLGSFMWQADGSVYVPQDIVGATRLERASTLGKIDFGAADAAFTDMLEDDQQSFVVLAGAILMAKNTVETLSADDFLNTLKPLLAPIEGPLACATAKHIGDLCADVDHWDRALSMYDEASRRLSTIEQTQWKEFAATFTAIVIQSRAAAVGVVHGAARASAVLTHELSGVSVSNIHLLLTNASVDTRVAIQEASDNITPVEVAPTVMLPPLLDDTHDLALPIFSWLEGNYTGSLHRFWAVLRRQLALGCATESRTTKAVYAWSVFESLDKTLAKRSDPDLFCMALRLILESGRHRLAAKVAWSEAFVDVYVTSDCVQLAIRHASRHRGSLIERQRVLLELFANWIQRISANSGDVAQAMLTELARIAKDGASSLFETKNLGGRALTIFGELAETRPELRRYATAEVAMAVVEKLRGAQFWTGKQEALDTANEYADAFSEDQLRSVITEALSLLQLASPTNQLWMIVRPALSLLVSPPAKELATKEPDLGMRILDQILRYGVEQETEHALLFFYLHNFDPSLLRSVAIGQKLQDAVLDVRKKSKEINASNANDNIRALLLAPSVTGRDGVTDALAALRQILESATSGHPSIALPYAYAPVLLLAAEHRRIANELSIAPATFQEELTAIFDLVVELWRLAEDRPMLFAQFAFPPATRPNPTIIHNWAFASVQLAASLERDPEIVSALELAAKEPAFAAPIALARTTLASISIGEMAGSLNIDGIRSENRDTFYTALGPRLVLVQKLPPREATDICKALLDQCFLYGPRELDAAVFLIADRLNLRDYVAGREHSNYRKRLEGNRQLRISLSAVLAMIDARG
jgi:hypothetical protein